MERHILGLDWFPSNRPKPGHEAEFAELSALDMGQLDDRRVAQAQERFREISESPFDFYRPEEHWRLLMFRGELLREAVEVIGKPLLDRAWQPQTAQELAAYGEALQAAALSFARKHLLDGAVFGPVPGTVPLDERESRLAACLIAMEAARWCLWWSAKGFGLSPDY